VLPIVRVVLPELVLGFVRATVAEAQADRQDFENLRVFLGFFPALTL